MAAVQSAGPSSGDIRQAERQTGVQIDRQPDSQNGRKDEGHWGWGSRSYEYIALRFCRGEGGICCCGDKTDSQTDIQRIDQPTSQAVIQTRKRAYKTTTRRPGREWGFGLYFH